MEGWHRTRGLSGAHFKDEIRRDPDPDRPARFEANGAWQQARRYCSGGREADPPRAAGASAAPGRAAAALADRLSARRARGACGRGIRKAAEGEKTGPRRREHRAGGRAGAVVEDPDGDPRENARTDRAGGAHTAEPQGAGAVARAETRADPDIVDVMRGGRFAG